MDYQNLILPTKGRTVKAIYRKNTIPTYVGNPLIEALPSILSTGNAIAELAYYPDYDESMRELPDHERYQLLEDIVRFFAPLNVHIDLERRFSRIIRSGYIERNPMKASFWKSNRKRADEVNDDSYSQYGRCSDFHSTSAYGFNLIGISGVGKSLAAERILRLCPQIIHHTKYHERNFTYSQIVWLKLDCPFDGSLKGLCINFFQAVDILLGTSYHKNYGSKSRNTDEMLPYMALVAANHSIGVLVIDEIQRLSLSRSGGVDKMLNFFVQLVNTVGVPIVLIGTYKSLSVFEGNFSQLRRGTGQGDLVWDRMKPDKEWNHFVKSLWYFQYTHEFCSLEDHPGLVDVLYEETQGITDLAVKAYMLAQERAIETGSEMITASIIRSVVKDKFRMLEPALTALKSKTKTGLERFEDAYPQFLAQYVKKSSKPSDKTLLEMPQIEGVIASAPEIRVLTKENKEVGNLDASVSKNEDSDLSGDKESSLTNLQVWLRNTGKTEAQLSELKKPVLPEILASISDKSSQNVHSILLAAGFIRPASEFMNEGGNVY